VAETYKGLLKIKLLHMIDLDTYSFVGKCKPWRRDFVWVLWIMLLHHAKTKENGKVHFSRIYSIYGVIIISRVLLT
jgi:hypothetical protein